MEKGGGYATVGLMPQRDGKSQSAEKEEPGTHAERNGVGGGEREKQQSVLQHVDP